LFASLLFVTEGLKPRVFLILAFLMESFKAVLGSCACPPGGQDGGLRERGTGSPNSGHNPPGIEKIRKFHKNPLKKQRRFFS
jgi:hypothetical protein